MKITDLDLKSKKQIIESKMDQLKKSYFQINLETKMLKNDIRFKTKVTLNESQLKLMETNFNLLDTELKKLNENETNVETVDNTNVEVMPELA